MHGMRTLPAVVAVLLALSSCGERDTVRLETAEAERPAPSLVRGPAAGAPISSLPSAPSLDKTQSREPAGNSSTGSIESSQPAVWPEPDVVFATPDEAAADFVEKVLGVEPATLGEFRAGDSRSGEIDVLFLGEGGGATPSVNSTLLLRQTGSGSGWFVIAGHSEFVSITSPAAGATVAAGPVEVDGMARGFEGTVVASAFTAGDSDAELDVEITRGGSRAATEPYRVTLDLSEAAPDSAVALLVRGDTAADGHTGEFSVIPVAIVARLPESR